MVGICGSNFGGNLRMTGDLNAPYELLTDQAIT